MKVLSDRLLHREDGSLSMPEDGAAARAELWAYFSELIEFRQEVPADDLMTGLIQAEVAGNDR